MFCYSFVTLNYLDIGVTIGYRADLVTNCYADSWRILRVLHILLGFSTFVVG